jgi:hypothetical protein
VCGAKVIQDHPAELVYARDPVSPRPGDAVQRGSAWYGALEHNPCTYQSSSHGDRFRQQSGVENLVIYTRIGLVLIVGGCQPCERGKLWAVDARITAVTAISAAQGVAEWSCGGSDRVKRTNCVG